MQKKADAQYGSTGCGIFKQGGTKLERFLPKNQNTQGNCSILRIELMGRCQKLGIILENRVI